MGRSNGFIKLLAKFLLFVPILMYASNSNAENTDRMYIEEIITNAGERIEIPVKLENKNAYSAFQCDILLPQGIQVETDEEGEMQIYAESSRMTSSHTLTTAVTQSGDIRVVCYSTASKEMKGNSGTLFYIKARVTDECSGELKIKLREIRVSNTQAEEVVLEDTEAAILVTPEQGEEPENTDRMYIEDIITNAGEILEIPVKLENKNAYSAFQCDILLPQGIQVETDEEGEMQIYAESSRMTSSHTLTTAVTQSGDIRVVCYSTASKEMKGNSGTLFYIKARVTDECSGELKIKLREIRVSNTQAEEVVLEDTEAAISVTPEQGEEPENTDRMYIEDIITNTGEILEIPVKLENKNAYSAFQCDILLPQGIQVETDEEGEMQIYAESSRMTSSHTLTTAVTQSGDIRVVCYSTASKEMKGNSGTLFYIKARVTDECSGELKIKLREIRVSNTQAEEVVLEDTEAAILVASNINEVLTNNELNDIFTIRGIAVKSAITENGLGNGIYIINGKKIYIKQQ